MGCDGGSIPRRSELVKTAQSAVRQDEAEAVRQASLYCALSDLPLREPVCADVLGRLYNLSAVIELLLRRRTDPVSEDPMPHLASKSGVTVLRLTGRLILIYKCLLPFFCLLSRSFV